MRHNMKVFGYRIANNTTIVCIKNFQDIWKLFSTIQIFQIWYLIAKLLRKPNQRGHWNSYIVNLLKSYRLNYVQLLVELPLKKGSDIAQLIKLPNRIPYRRWTFI